MGWLAAVDAEWMDVPVERPRARRRNPVFWMVKVAALMAALSLFMDFVESRDETRAGGTRGAANGQAGGAKRRVEASGGGQALRAGDSGAATSGPSTVPARAPSSAPR